MRKLTVRYKRWLRFHASKNAKRSSRGHGRIAVINFGEKQRFIRVGVPWSIPDVLCLDKNCVESLSFFYDIRHRTQRKIIGGALLPPQNRRGGRIRWLRNFYDFSHLKYISAGAALIVAAEYDRIARLHGIPPATIDVHKWDPYVATILSRLGFYEILRINADKAERDDAILIEKMVAQGTYNLGRGMQAIKNLFEAVGGDESLRVALGSAVSDAVENVLNHAYPDNWDERSKRVPFWWFVGAADPKAKRLTLAVFDQGITIPASLPRRWSIDHLNTICKDLFNSPFRPDDRSFDGSAINAAMALGATSTGLSNRGKGLSKIREIVLRCPEGRLKIVSGFGECVYGADGYESVKSLSVPLRGTYVELQASFRG